MQVCNALNMEGWQPPATPPPTEVEDYQFARLIAALMRLPAEYRDDYTKWIPVLIALKNTDPELRHVAEKWSQGSRKYDADGFAQAWDGIKPRGDLTWRSVCHWAGEPQGEQPEYRFHDGVDFLNMQFPQNDLIKGCLVENQACVVGGGLKTLKTTLSMEAGISVATATDFLFRYPVIKRGPAAFMSAESGERTLQETMQRILDAKGVTLERGYFRITPVVPMLTQPLESLEKLLVDWGIIFLVLDPLYLAMDGEQANNIFKMGEQLRNVGQMCAENRITLMLNHHVNKSAGRSGRITPNDLQWSGCGEFARQWWLLNRETPYVEGSGKHDLHLSIGSSSGLSKSLQLNVNEGVRPESPTDPPRVWEVDVLSGGEARAVTADAKYQAAVTAVFNAMKDSDPLGQCKISKLAGIAWSTWTGYRERMFAEGVLVPTPETANDRHPLYQVRQQCT